MDDRSSISEDFGRFKWAAQWRGGRKMDGRSSNNLLMWMNRDLGVVYQDGGLPVEGRARTLDKNRWDEIIKKIFLVSEQ